MGELGRRTFLKGAMVTSIAGAAGMSLTGCSQPSVASPEEENGSIPNNPNDTAYSSVNELTDGKYVTKAMGHEDYIFVETTISNGTLSDIKVLRQHETRGIGSWACNNYPAKLLEAQNLDIDALSGATRSCAAIVNAVKEGIANAGGNPDDYCKGPQEPSGGSAHTENVDVVVVGAGTAGLVAACRLLEKGFNTLVFEKNSIPGGSMSMTYSGLISTHSKLQENFSLGTFDDHREYDLETRMEYILDAYPVEDDRFNYEMPYQRALYNTSGLLVDWMHDIGIGFHTMGVSSAYSITPYLAPGCYMGGCGQAMEFLVNRIGMLGGTIVYDTPVTELIQDETGKVSGVKAEGIDGSTWEVTAKAVCLASGGFAANEEMKQEYYPDYIDYPWNCAPGSTGDGIVMGQAVGAGVECMGRDLGAFLSTTTDAAGTHFELAFIHVTAPGLLVNASGDQFANVMNDNHGTMASAILDDANGGKFFYIVDESGANGMMQAQLGYEFETYSALFSRGDAIHYATIEEAQEATGMTNLASTIEMNNAHALAEDEDEFGRTGVPYIDTHDGIWVVPCTPTFYVTTGGLIIDTSAHVLKDDQSIVEGLYAAGDVCGSIEEKDGKPYGIGFDAALNYGYIMAETVESEIA